MPLVVFGNGRKNKNHIKSKGLRYGVSEKLYNRQLKLREKLGKLLLLNINEFNTSKICNDCFPKSLENLKSDKYKIHQVLICKNCSIFWNRNVMASKNMYTIWNSDVRANVLQRQCVTSNVAAALYHI